MEQQAYGENNTRIIPEREHLLKMRMFTFLFEGGTSSRVELYYNNIQDKLSNTSSYFLY
jgi:hypothetical protein